MPDLPAQLSGIQTPGGDARGFVFELRETASGLQIFAAHHPQYSGVGIDWNSSDIRRRIQAGRKQLLSRAVGLHKRPALTIFDATAGLGRDAYTLAALGAEVWMSERQPLFDALLEDALKRAQQHASCQPIAARMRLLTGDARMHLAQGRWDVIYLDPMYPGHARDARSKKEMQFLRELTGGDEDAATLLPLALAHANQRVVVKRPLAAPLLSAQAPNYQLKGTQARFDIYLVHPSAA